MEVLVTGGDTEIGRAIAEGFRDAGHHVVISGAQRDELEVAAKELDVDAIVCDPTDPASLAEARTQFPHHLDAIVNVPAPRWEGGDPRTFGLTEHATAWRNALDATALDHDWPDEWRRSERRCLRRGGAHQRRHAHRGCVRCPPRHRSMDSRLTACWKARLLY